ncbi:hypothetical protein KP509_13G057500 [Ceratopteris richardii]|uniref:DUF659 domain-containing protein n=1 Tax=Ceratopteris richardii TaxID=49495 RepID=A0A8T2TJ32_CERRI|nr:hypothetical protein KP509_13G057500 [Ceratopteris richardii]
MGKGREWSYVIVHQEGKTISTIQCKCCGHCYVGNVTRIKEHLFSTGNNVAGCSNPNSDIWVHFASYANKCKSQGITSKRLKSMTNSQHVRSNPSVEQGRVDALMTIEDHQDISTQVSQTLFYNNQDTCTPFSPTASKKSGFGECSKNSGFNTLSPCFVPNKSQNTIHNVTPIVTNNASNFLSAGITIQNKYEGITWVPCAAHTLNLLLKDIGRLSFIKQSLLDENHVVKFIREHQFSYLLFRSKSPNKALQIFCAIRFATTYIVLSGLLEVKLALVEIIDDRRWEIWLEKTTFILDPRFQLNGQASNKEVMENFKNTCQLLLPGTYGRDAFHQRLAYVNREGYFGDLWHIEAIQKHPPPIWWKEYGGEAVELQHITMRVLSKAASSDSTHF